MRTSSNLQHDLQHFRGKRCAHVITADHIFGAGQGSPNGKDGNDLGHKSLPPQVVRLEGFEPTTRGLRIRCSAG